MQTPILILTTSDQQNTLELIANQLVENRLAACCQINGPAKSIYRWNDQLENAQEWSCSIKTTAAVADRVVAMIRENHNYDEPEIIRVDITGGSESYLKWLQEQIHP